MNWKIDEEIRYDTLPVNQSITHEFLCEGSYIIHAIAYDTGTVCSETKAYIEKEIYIQPVEVEIINVTVSQLEENAIDIKCFHICV